MPLSRNTPGACKHVQVQVSHHNHLIDSKQVKIILENIHNQFHYTRLKQDKQNKKRKERVKWPGTIHDHIELQQDIVKLKSL